MAAQIDSIIDTVMKIHRRAGKAPYPRELSHSLRFICQGTSQGGK
jgi:hypothetical protein